MIGIGDETQRYFKLCLCGGTFDRLHMAHRVLLEVALTLAKQVAIGVTSDEMVQGKVAAEKIQPYQERVKQLKEYLKSQNFQGRFEIVQLTKPEGTSEELENADAMIVSEETHPMLDKINSVRISRGLTPLVKIFVPYILTNSGQPYRSTNLRLEEE
ncbi:MAG: pantetheine-phosphate adenylyltransferase [Candidatus Hodarchaeota archaeon]